MSTYVIGDVQGCLTPLEQLLTKIQYRPGQDQLWFTGDVVNRGRHSLETLRFIKQLPADTVCVLGNHDLALLAIANGFTPMHPKDTLADILNALDKADLLDWLRYRPLLHHDADLGFTLIHAGIYPLWDLTQAKALAHEIEVLLQGADYQKFLQNMYGNFPEMWDPSLKGWDRTRFITNAFTRMRFCTPQGELNLKAKGTLEQHPHDIPWFAFPNRQTQTEKLVFGHWAALGTLSEIPNIYPLDSGCVWGKCLTAFCLQTKEKTTVDCKDYIHQPLSI
jgi:bis(5'-nucleosyl)-tetraphosphatase (symmetrical)